MQTVWTLIRTNRMLVLIWVQTVDTLIVFMQYIFENSIFKSPQMTKREFYTLSDSPCGPVLRCTAYGIK